MSKLILPIKCSTVRKTKSVLEHIIYIEYQLFNIIGTMYFVLALYSGSVTPNMSDMDLALFILSLISFSIFGAYICGYAPDYIRYSISKIPSIECINDEENK